MTRLTKQICPSACESLPLLVIRPRPKETHAHTDSFSQSVLRHSRPQFFAATPCRATHRRNDPDSHPSSKYERLISTLYLLGQADWIVSQISRGQLILRRDHENNAAPRSMTDGCDRWHHSKVIPRCQWRHHHAGLSTLRFSSPMLTPSPRPAFTPQTVSVVRRCGQLCR